VENIVKPFGRIHWAGSETSKEWYGYMEGAVASAERVAEEIGASVQKAKL
jgi:monoamine oxidase